MIGSPDAYIPYEAIAFTAIKDDVEPRVFLYSIFPEATQEQTDKFLDYLVGVYHDGLEVGLELSDRDPMKAAEAYRFGVTEGEQNTLDNIRKLGEK